MCHSKNKGHIMTLSLMNDCSTMGDIYFLGQKCMRDTIQIRIATLLFQIRHLCRLTLVTRKLQDVYERCTYRMTALLSERSILDVRAGCEIRLLGYGSKHSLKLFPISDLCVLISKMNLLCNVSTSIVSMYVTQSK